MSDPGLRSPGTLVPVTERRHLRKPAALGRAWPPPVYLAQGGGPGSGQRSFDSTLGSALAENLGAPTTGGSGIGTRPLSEWIGDIDERVRWDMDRSEARSVQLAIVIDGRLKLARAYTLAEIGYPMTQTRHLFNIGSCSKMLTAMRVIDLFAETVVDNGQVVTRLQDVKLPELLGLSDLDLAPKLLHDYTDATRFMSTTLAQMLWFQASWRPEDDLDWTGSVHELSGHPRPNEPGDMRKFLKDFPGPLYKVAPGDQAGYYYHNFYAVALAEIISGKETGDWDKYEDLMREWWGLDEKQARSLPYTREECLANGVIPLHQWEPNATTLYRKNFLPSLQPGAYTGGDPGWAVGGGHWAMSAYTMARIVAGLDPPPGTVRQLLGPAHAALMSAPSPLQMTQGLGQLNTGNVTTTDGSTYFFLWKNGGAGGSCSNVCHYLPLSPDLAPMRSMTIAFDIAVSGASTAVEDLTDYLDFATRIHKLGYWPDDLDLFSLAV